MKNYFFLLILSLIMSACADKVRIVTDENASERVVFGAEKLADVLKEAGYEVSHTKEWNLDSKGRTIVIGDLQSEMVQQISGKAGFQFEKTGKEGFNIKSEKDVIVVAGTDASGALYGALELGEKIKAAKKMPKEINLTDQPEMVLRGAAIGMQKMEILPGRSVYEYPYTPENFPWFYDKEHWVRYLDMLVENRLNSLYLWNGHPFASLVKLEDYPYAVEVDDETFRMNEDIFHFITEEADKRGIFVIQMFYNIIVSQPFAEYHGIKTQDRSRPIVPLIADYTRKSIARFIEKYPNVGLLVCLGEAMERSDDVEWFTQTIIPGVKDGLKALGRTDEPPILLRAHDTDGKMVMEASLPIYKNLYTMHKYNGESLTTYEPQGPWTQIHRDLSALGSVHISNVHVLANLEPFRWGSPDFVQKTVKAMHNIHGANGLHLYPQASYWDWPYSADKVNGRLLQIERDWMWYEIWSRYAWKKDREREKEVQYWAAKLGDFYACGDQGANILEAYEQTGEIAPKLLRKFGITEGNRQTLLLGMFMSQLVNPYRWRVYPGFYESCGPDGEILIEYARKEWNKEPHKGETPPQLVSEAVHHAKLAVEAIEKAAPHVKTQKEEFERLRNDVMAYNAFANFFSEKVKAAMLVLQYSHSKTIADLDQALPLLESSLEHYRELVGLTNETYLYANSMQTGMRRIPVRGNDGKYKHWSEMLPLYEKELESYKKNLQTLKVIEQGGEVVKKEILPFAQASVQLKNKNPNAFYLTSGKRVFADNGSKVKGVAPELQNLQALLLSEKKQIEEGTTIAFSSTKPVKVLVGFFNTDEKDYLKPANLETDANANNQGQAEVLIANALDIEGMPRVNVHSFYFEPGDQTLQLGKGKVLVLGIIDGTENLQSRDAGLGIGKDENIDWLFY